MRITIGSRSNCSLYPILELTFLKACPDLSVGSCTAHTTTTSKNTNIERELLLAANVIFGISLLFLLVFFRADNFGRRVQHNS